MAIRKLFSVFRDLLTVGSANILSSAIASLFWLFMAPILGTEEYGQFSYFIAIASILGVVSLLGVGNTIIVYTSKEEKTQSSLYHLVLIIGIIVSVASYFVVQNIGVSVIIIGTVIFGIVTTESLGKKNFKKYATLMISQRIFQVILALLLYYIQGVDGLILGYGISYVVFLPIVLSSIRKEPFDVSLIHKRFKFMMHNYSLDISRRLSLSIDKIIIAPLFGFALLGNYQLGIQIILVMSIIPQSVFQYMLPSESKGIHRYKKLKILTIASSIIFAVVSFVAAPYIIPVLFEEFTGTAEIIQILSIAIVPLTVEMMYASKLLALEKSIPILIGSIIFTASLAILIIILGAEVGIMGFGYAFIISTSLKAGYYSIINKRI